MPIYALTDEELVPVAATSFSAENIHERRHIQQLLKANISVLDPGLMVIAEEFGDWIDSSRRIDLLCIDTDANLVVVELKRTEDGGHMELQALRYAAMISAMTFEQLVETYARYLNPGQPDHDDALAAILQFLGWDSPNEDQFGQDTRIILASADFSRELTTTVLWLRDRKTDVRCVRLKPYRMADESILLDVQELIPLPETASFQTQIGSKRQAERNQRSERHELRHRFLSGLLDYARTRTVLHSDRRPTTANYVLARLERSGFQIGYVVRRQDSQIELWISHGGDRDVANRAAFEQLNAQKEAIEAEFGNELEWMPDETNGCRIRFVIEGGWQSPDREWQIIHERLVDAMIRLDCAIRDRVAALEL